MMTTAAITPNNNQRELPLLPADTPLFEPELDLGICERFAINSLSESIVFWECQGSACCLTRIVMAVYHKQNERQLTNPGLCRIMAQVSSQPRAGGCQVLGRGSRRRCPATPSHIAHSRLLLPLIALSSG